MTFQNKNKLMDRSSYLPSAFGMDVSDTDIICKVKKKCCQQPNVPLLVTSPSTVNSTLQNLTNIRLVLTEHAGFFYPFSSKNSQ